MDSSRGVPWEDLEVLLTLLREGSLNRTARTLKIGTATVSRRLARLEERLGSPLFDRTPEGMQPTALAHDLRPHAELVEQQMHDIQRVIEQQEAEPRGRLRIAMPDGIASAWLLPNLHGFLERYPLIEPDLVIGHELVDLVRRDADVALRFVPPEGDLVCRTLGTIPVEPYALPSVAAEDPTSWRWVMLDDPDSRYPETSWLAEHADVRRSLRVSSWNTLYAGILNGIGPGMLSPIVAERQGLVRVLPDRPEGPRHTLYLVVHRALRRVPRIHAFREWLLETAPGHLGP